jgi:hypothetical protein
MPKTEIKRTNTVKDGRMDNWPFNINRKNRQTQEDLDKTRRNITLHGSEDANICTCTAEVLVKIIKTVCFLK